ncbi:hypothetical protein DM01DRAFT_1381151 [Hesseltinella vesiculosa]|uniref:F-box domain-containing protein n=1 Tax=Hesseltinella vesiculosa TaxID=101127 RepID=A0A1X2GRH4_9FUNG|nr:hypothetical protein DM01DRAFT_1381151 [Hesseltinella vesiculosa]
MDRLSLDVLQQVISYIPFPTRWQAAMVSRLWYQACHDPYLYQHIHLENLELADLVHVLQWIQRLQPNIRSLSMRHCYSSLLQRCVPVRYSDDYQNQSPSVLHTQIRALAAPQREAQYQALNIDLYHQLNQHLLQLVNMSSRLTSIAIEHCNIDWAMTALIPSLINHGANLKTWIYHSNFGDLLPTADALQAFMTATPNMTCFLGHHPDAINDHSVSLMPRLWPLLQSMQLACTNTLPFSSKGSSSMPVATSPLSSHVFYQWLAASPRLQSLELVDLHCLSDQDLQSAALAFPMATVATSLRHLRIAKFVTEPLSNAGINHLLQLLPRLRTLAYDTNIDCFRITTGLPPQQVAHLWSSLAKQHAASPLDLRMNWHQPVTMEQTLLSCQLMATQ